MRHPTPAEMNNFLALLTPQKINRATTFLSGLTDVERKMTVGEFCQSHRTTDTKNIPLMLFDRLEREIADHEKASSLFDRAKTVANG